MIKRISLVLSLVLLVLLVAVAAADSRPLGVAVGYEQALNLGDIDTVATLFAADAVYVNGIGGAEVAGREAIHTLLATQHRSFRAVEIVGASLTGDRLTLVIDISDHGVAWGRQTLRAVVKDGLIQRLEPIAFRFLF